MIILLHLLLGNTEADEVIEEEVMKWWNQDEVMKSSCVIKVSK